MAKKTATPIENKVEEIKLNNKTPKVNKRFFGIKTATCAVLLSIIVAITIFTFLDEIVDLERDQSFWIILSTIAIIANSIVIFAMVCIRHEILVNEHNNIFAANSLYVEIYSECGSLTGEICGLILHILVYVLTKEQMHNIINIKSILEVFHFFALPCSMLALSLVLHRLYQYIKPDYNAC